MLSAALRILSVATMTTLLSHDPALAQGMDRYEFCNKFFGESRYTPFLGSMSPAFRLDRDRGIQINSYWLKKVGAKSFEGATADRLETIPDGKGDLRGVKEGLQLIDLGGDPRRFEITEDYIENYAEKFLRVPRPLNPKPISAQIYRYSFEYRSGICVPTAVTKIDGGTETKLFDLDRCQQHSSRMRRGVDAHLDCNALPVYSEILADSRFADIPAKSSRSAHANQ